MKKVEIIKRLKIGHGESRSGGSSSENVRVLLIEDNPGYSEIIRIMLDKIQDTRFELLRVNRLTEGLHYLEKDSVDIILLDLKLPDSHGIETFNKVYKQAQGLPIIVLTVTDNDGLALEAVQKGAQDYLVKEQVDKKLLVRAIRYAIERKRMEEMLLNAAQEWRTTFDAISDVVCLINSESKIIRCNRAMTNLLGKPFDDIIGQSCCELVHGSRDPIDGCPFERIKKTHGHEAIVSQRGDQWFRISIDPLVDEEDNLVGGVHIMADITKEQEIDKMKNELISNVSHELRTPLSTIQEGIALLYDGSLGPLHPDQQDMLARVTNNIDRLSRLINDLLDMSKIEAGRMELKKSLVNITTLVEKVISSFRSQAQHKKIELSTRMPKDIHLLFIDRDRISQVLNNLISNSVKFTPAQGRISIEVKDKKNEVEICVTDTGIGISPQNIAGLFDRFSQFNRAYGPGERGTGLGLSISKEIITMHGGQIWVKSEVGKGSAFIFTLPYMTQDEIFREYLTKGLREAQMNECPLSLVVIRIKNIEGLIKTYTNAQVFAILREIEELIGRTLRRKSDIVSRYKYGEIIIAILMDTAKRDALAVKERIRQEIEAEIRGKEWPKDLELFLDIVTFPDDAVNERELINKVAQGLWTKDKRERAEGGKDG